MSNFDKWEAEQKEFMNDERSTLSFEELVECKHPTEKEIREYMDNSGGSYYNSREKLREKAYGGKPPGNYQSWGDYWKGI